MSTGGRTMKSAAGRRTGDQLGRRRRQRRPARQAPRIVFPYPLQRDWPAVLLGEPCPVHAGQCPSGSGDGLLSRARVRIATTVPVVDPASQSPTLTLLLICLPSRPLAPTLPTSSIPCSESSRPKCLCPQLLGNQRYLSSVSSSWSLVRLDRILDWILDSRGIRSRGNRPGYGASVTRSL